MSERSEIDTYLNRLLVADRFKDYCPNGLQVEGKPVVERLVTGVTASLALIEAAAEQGADAILVHHGLFWRGHDGRLTGWLKKRVERLMASGINLWAYHLPLDAHPELGNNARLGARMGWMAESRFGDQDLGWLGTACEPMKATEFAQHLAVQFGREPLLLPGDGRLLRRVAWCTGGAQGYFDAAIAAGADVFVTGEASEPQAHLAAETGVAFLACGHHATERDGVAAVGAHLGLQFGLEHVFIDIPNPS